MGYKPVLRHALRQLVRVPLPGRYMLVEMLRSLISQPTPVHARAYGGLHFMLDLNDRPQRQIFFGLYEPEDIALLRQLLKPGEAFFDVGCNVGLYALIAAGLVGPQGQIHGFEPVPANVTTILRNLELNGLCDRVYVNPVAVGETCGAIELFLPATATESGWASLVRTAGRPYSVTVPMISLDSYIVQHNIVQVDLIKIDVEGAELRVFQGMRALLSSLRPPIIYFEINPFFLQRQQIAAATLKEFVVSFGYRLYAYEQQRLLAVDPHGPEERLRNILAIPRSRQLDNSSRLFSAISRLEE
jgi:FkbM family methyltransferase